MKIVHLSRLYWPSIGGVETHLLNLNQQLANHQVTVITEQFGHSLKLSETHQGVLIKRLVVLKSQSGWKYKFLVWQGILKYLKTLQSADIIQVHDVFWWLLPFLPWLMFKRIYITFHGYEGSNQPRLPAIFWHWVAAKLTRANLGVGGFHQRWYHLQPTLTTYGAMNRTDQTNLLSHNQNKVLNLIYVGRLADDIGISTYLAAIKILQAQKIKVHLDIYGDGPLKKMAKKMVAQAKLDVTFYGAVNANKIHYQRYQIALVSRYLSILEALSAGVPVIAHYNNQIKYDYLALAPFAKWIKIVADPDQMAAAIIDQQQLPAAAMTWAQHQTWQKLAALYEQLWQI